MNAHIQPLRKVAGGAQSRPSRPRAAAVAEPVAKAPASAQAVGAVLQEYAERGIFRGFNRGPSGESRAVFWLLWHGNRIFELVLEAEKDILRLRTLLPRVPVRSPMYRELKTFVNSFFSEERPAHRRIDATRARLRVTNRRGTVSLTLSFRNGEYDYGTRRLVHLVQEIFLSFLADGPYIDYRVENLGLDPDHHWA